MFWVTFSLLHSPFRSVALKKLLRNLLKEENSQEAQTLKMSNP